MLTKLPLLSQQSYEAYGFSTDFKNYQGNPMPTWEQLPEAIQDAWTASVIRIAKLLNPNNSKDFLTVQLLEELHLVKQITNWGQPLVLNAKNTLRRTIVRIINIDGELIEAVIPGWNPHETIHFSTSLVPEEIMDVLERDNYSFARDVLQQPNHLFAYVNTSAEEAEDLHLERFELAPEPNENDGLAPETPQTLTLGQINYEAYRDAILLNYQGNPLLPAWTSLNSEAQSAFEKAAQTVLSARFNPAIHKSQ
jgi:hypothetical protein